MKKLLYIIILLVPVFITNCKINVDYPSVYEQIKDSYEKQDYDATISLIRNANIKRSQKTDWYYYYLGMSVYKKSKQNTREAIENLKIAIAFKKNNPEYKFSIGQMYFDIGEYKKSLTNLKKAYSLCKENNTAIPNLNFWILINLDKMGNFRVEEFIKEFNTDESNYLKQFSEQILQKRISYKYIDSLIDSQEFTVEEKLMILDVLLNNCPNSSEICETMLEKDIKEEYTQFFTIKMLSCSFDNLQNCKDLLRKISIEVGNDIFIIESSSYFIYQIFNKYLCWYYFIENDDESAVNALRAYQIQKYKPKTFKHNTSDDIELIMREFKNDKEFQSIIEYRN